MSNSMKNGFSTLNRWLGKKNKEKSAAPNGKLSKSSTNLNLSISTTNINDTSQLEYNRIAPLPAVTSNAPFEQTFRITVLLPKDQLYVARLGARVPMSKLLELVCDHKSLDPEKYEFRNPVDPSQIYSCDLTIGAVGLSEIRLCHKSDSYDSYSTDEMTKLNRTSAARGSLSSSEFSSRSNSKHTTKTASPYSSSNSLNSMDSSGVNYTHSPVSPLPPLPKSTPPKVSAPPRKKRAAPRPPSQLVIPEKTALVIDHESQDTEQTIDKLKQQQETMGLNSTRKDYYSSTPNLSSPNNDCNGNINRESLPITVPLTESITNGNLTENNEVIYAQVAQKNARNLYSGSVQNLSSEREQSSKFPEPSPRKRLLHIKKKAAPAPPPRGSSNYDNEDALSIASTTVSTPDTPGGEDSEKSLRLNGIHEQFENSRDIDETPTNLETSNSMKEPLKASTPVLEGTKLQSPPKPVPRQTTTTLLNSTTNSLSPGPTTTLPTHHTNVSKVLLNRTPTPEPRSLSTEPQDIEDHLPNTSEDDDNMSKQADSGIGEPIPSPLPDSLPSEGSAHECKSTFESSSDDDDIVKIYNFKLGRTTIKNNIHQPEPKTLAELSALQADDSGETTPAISAQETTPNTSETTSWNFAIPISPPPNFADSNIQSDSPITPKIMERPVLNFDNLSATEKSNKDVVDHKVVTATTTAECPRTPLPSPSSPINEIIDELSTILNENRMNTLIKKHDDSEEIQSAKPNTLTNFTITSLSVQQATFNEPTTPTTPTTSPIDEEEKLYKKRNSITNVQLKQRKSVVTRADSFHATNGSQNQTPPKSDGLNSRSSSFLSLTKLEQGSTMLNGRRSSSELSIGESPSLQSLEVIKTILNSRKNSLANSSDGETKNLNEKRSSPELKAEELKPKQEVQREVSSPQETESESSKPKELPKVYRYSGPPSINFSTWSERPKVQVAIKNEGDYIFGGKNAGSQNAAVTQAAIEIRENSVKVRSQRASMPAYAIHETSKHSSPPPVAPKPLVTSPTERMGIPEKDFIVPITVKPLKDVTVEKVIIPPKKPIEQNPIIRHQSKEVSNTSTLPRTGNAANRFSTPAKSITPGPTLLRSTSITQLEKKNSKSSEMDTTATITMAPFGQNTLRRTGLKEKILANEEQVQKQQTNVNVNASKPPNSGVSTIHVNGTASSSFKGSQNPSTTKLLQSAKLELKLQDTTTQSFVRQQNGNWVSPTPRVTTPKSAPPAPTPPAPPMPILRSVALRSQSANTAASPTTGDQRDALLEAIRSFKRNELNKV